MQAYGDKLSGFWGRINPKIASRQRTKEILSTLVIVVPLTLLIWIYAERAQDVKDTVEITPKVVMTEPTLIATVVSPASGALALDVEGPNALIGQLKTQLAERAMENALTLTLPPALTHVGQQNVDIANTLNNDPLFLNSGVTITKATPPFMTVTVDPLASPSVPVALPPDLASSLQNVTFDPPTVIVRGPKPRVEAQFPGNTPVLVDVANQAAQFTGGGTRTIELPLVALPQDSHLTMSPQKVKMTFEVGTRDREVTIRNPIKIVVQKPLSLERYQVILKSNPVINNVIIRGPANVVSKFEDSSAVAGLTAVLPIQLGDEGQTDRQRAVQIEGLPAGVRLVGAPPNLDFDVVSRGSTDQ